MRISALLSIVLLIATTALAQKEVSPPPKPAGSGPSLEATMRFIQKHLSDPGKVSYVHTYSSGTGDRWVIQKTRDFTDVLADAGTCKISFRTSVVILSHGYPQQGDPLTTSSTYAATYEFFVRDVSRLEIVPGLEDVRSNWVKNGTPFPEDYRLDPEVFVLRAHLSGEKKLSWHNWVSTPEDKSQAESGSGNGPALFLFREEEMAQRVAKAMVHAVELCGGGQTEEEKEPF